LKQLGSFIIAAGTMLGVVVLTGCVSSKPAVPPHATVLLSVVLRGELAGDRQPTGLIVTLDGTDAVEGKPFAFSPTTRIPGHYTTFLVRLDLPGGHHRLTGLSGVSGNGVPAPEFDVVLNRPFEAQNRQTEYLGHFELSYTRATGSSAPERGPLMSGLVLADAYADDFPDFVHAWPNLRRAFVARRAPPDMVTVATGFRNPAALNPPAGQAGQSATVARLDASAAAGLPPRAQVAFRAFLKSPYPRAFVVASSGDSGTAVGGGDVIERAVRSCRRGLPSAKKPGCRLFALDDTLISLKQ